MVASFQLGVSDGAEPELEEPKTFGGPLTTEVANGVVGPLRELRLGLWGLESLGFGQS